MVKNKVFLFLVVNVSCGPTGHRQVLEHSVKWLKNIGQDYTHDVIISNLQKSKFYIEPVKVNQGIYESAWDLEK